MQSSQPQNQWGQVGTLEPLLGTSEPREPLRGTLCWLWSIPKPYIPLLETLFWNLHLELLLGSSEPLGTFTWNFGTSWILLWTLQTWEPLGTLTWNPYLEPRNVPEPSLGTFGCLETSLLDLLLGTSWIFYLEPLLGTSEPSGPFTWNPYLEQRNSQNLSGWLPQSAPGPSLAETPKLSAGEKTKILRFKNTEEYGMYMYILKKQGNKNKHVASEHCRVRKSRSRFSWGDPYVLQALAQLVDRQEKFGDLLLKKKSKRV